MELLKQHIESLIFVSENSLTVDDIRSCLQSLYGWELGKEEVKNALNEIQNKYASEDFSFELMEIAEGFSFMTKKEYHATVQALVEYKEKKRLSTAALETLAIIAYKQPVSKAEIETVRGVSCDYSIQKLLEKDLIIIEGKSDGPGRPLLYATSKTFMDHFGLKNIEDLPKLKDLTQPSENEIGTPESENS